MLAGMNPPAPSGSGGASPDESSGRVPGTTGTGLPVGADQAKSSADAKLSSDVQALRGMEAALLEMAQSYPGATKALRSASEAIRSAQRQIVASPSSQEPPVPNTFA